MYKIEFVKSAYKDLQKIPQKDQRKVLEALNTLRINPFSELIKYRKIKALENLFRIRVGNYRVVYSVEKDILTIVVIRVGHRKDIYQGSH